MPRKPAPAKTAVVKRKPSKTTYTSLLSETESDFEAEIFKTFGTALGDRRDELMEFFALLAEYGSVKLACLDSGIPFRDIIALRKISPDFDAHVKRQVQLCEQDGLRRKVIDNAMIGERETYFDKDGKVKGFVRRDNTKVALEVLKTIDPRYNSDSGVQNLNTIINVGK